MTNQIRTVIASGGPSYVNKYFHSELSIYQVKELVKSLLKNVVAK